MRTLQNLSSFTSRDFYLLEQEDRTPDSLSGMFSDEQLRQFLRDELNYREREFNEIEDLSEEVSEVLNS
jgi:hypothetical protein